MHRRRKLMRTSRWILKKIGEYEMTGAQKTDDVYKLMDSQKTRENEVTGTQKTDDVYKLKDSQKTREYKHRRKLMMCTS